MKKWQKLVQNHLEAVRNTNSPLNGLRCNSPVVNGSVKNDEQANSPTEPASKIERKSKGTKRKRLSVDSPSIVETQGNAEVSKKDNTLSKEKKDFGDSFHFSGSISNQSSLDSEENLTQGYSAADCSQNLAANSLKRTKTEDGENNCHQESIQVESDTQTTSKNNTSSPAEVASLAQTINSDHTDVRWEGKDVGQQTDDLLEQDNENSEKISPDLMLNVEEQANGINGRFGEDGTWCSWSETMSYNEGSLIILPYVLLE